MKATGLSSRSTIERRMELAKNYSLDEFLRYAERDVSPTTLVDIQRADPRLHEALLSLVYDQVSCSELSMLIKQGRKLLLEQEKAENLDLQNCLEADLANDRKDRDQRRYSRGPQAGPSGPKPADAAEVADLRAQVRTQEAAVSQAETRVHVLTLELTTIKEKCQAEAHVVLEAQARIQAERDDLAAQKQQVLALEQIAQEAAHRGGTVFELIEEQHQQVQAEKALLTEQESALFVQKRHLDQQAQDLALREGGLSKAAEKEAQILARTAELNAGLAALQERLSNQQAQVEELARRQAEVEAGEEALVLEQQKTYEFHASLELQKERQAGEQERQDDHAETLIAEQQRLSKEGYDVVQWAASRSGFRWEDCDHEDLDLILLQMVHLFERFARLNDNTIRLLNGSEYEAPEQGGLGLIFRVAGMLKNMHIDISALIQRIGNQFAEQYPISAQEYYDKQAQEKHAGVLPADPAGPQPPPLEPPPPPKPPRKFLLQPAALLGTKLTSSPQSGVLGFIEDLELLRVLYIREGRVPPWATLEMCLNLVHSIAIFGGQDSGKSNTVLSIIEMLQQRIANISDIQKPLAVIYGHYHSDANAYPPGVARANAANNEKKSLQRLKERLNAQPQGMGGRKLVLVPPLDESLFAQRQREYEGMEVRVLGIPLCNLDGEKLKLLMGASKNSSLYLMKVSRVIDELMMSLAPGTTLTWDRLIEALDKEKFAPKVRDTLDERLRQVRRFVKDGPSLKDEARPGDSIIIDMRAPWMDEMQAMVVFTVLMDIFSQATVAEVNEKGQTEQVLFYKVMVFDEAHKYMGACGVLAAKIEKMIREMRHRRMWVITASQDPESVPPGIIKFATMVIMHRTNSKKSLNYVSGLCAGWDKVRIDQLATLEQGEGYVLATDCADPAFRMVARRVRMRPSCAMPGGTTYEAVPVAEVQSRE